MTLPARMGVILSLVLLFVTRLYAAPPDLETRITIHLSDAAMPNAAMAISKLSGIGVIAPQEPSKDISLYLKDQPLHKVLDGLATASGTKWSLVDEIVVFAQPVTESKQAVSKPVEVLTIEQAMAEMISSLNPFQLYRLASGSPISYAEMNPYQQDLLKSMLSPPAVGVTESGDVVRGLPTPEQASISFISLPYLAVSKSAKESMTLRLDSTSYTMLKKAAPR